MDDDTIRTDDALISTDVDKLMRIISEKKKLSLGELHRLSGMKSRNALETWVKVLEDEGYVRMEYGLMGTYVRWVGMTYHPPSPEKAMAETKIIQTDDYVDEDDEPSFNVNEEEKEDDFTVEDPMVDKADEDDLSPEELLERYVKRKRTVDVDEEDDVKDSIVKNLGEEQEEHYSEEKEETEDQSEQEDQTEAQEDELTPATIAEEETIEPAVLEESESEKTEEGVNEVETEEMTEPETPVEDAEMEEIPEEIEEVSEPRSVYDGDVKDLIAAYMEEIKDEKQKLGQLKKQKEMFYKDELSTLERKAEGELVSFMDYILKHENKLLEVKEGVIDLPEKIQDAVKLQDELDRLRVEGKKSMSETKKKVSGFVDNMKTSEKQLKNNISNLRSSIEENEKKVDALERLRESVDGRSEKVMSSMESIRNKVTDLNDRMVSLEQYLSESSNMKKEIENEIENLKSDIQNKENDINEIETELSEVAKLSVWIKEYLNDYEAKITDIDAYVEKSDQEIASLKSAAEAKYIRKYLGELESISERYSDSLAHAIKTDKQLDDEIEKSKHRIADLIKESQKLIRKVGGEVENSPDYDAVKKKISNKTTKMRKTVEEKDNEKDSLAEIIKKKKKRKK